MPPSTSSRSHLVAHDKVSEGQGQEVTLSESEGSQAFIGLLLADILNTPE